MSQCLWVLVSHPWYPKSLCGKLVWFHNRHLVPSHWWFPTTTFHTVSFKMIMRDFSLYFQLMPTYMIFVLVKEDYIFFYGLKGASLPHDIQVKILFNKDKATKTIVSCNYTLHVLFTTKKYQHSHIPLA